MRKSWLRRLAGGAAAGPRPSFRPCLEVLEDRSVPALVVTDSLTPAALVANLVGSGVTVSNITYKGNNVSSGTFTGGTGIIGFDSGVILSNGHAKGVIGPNVDTGGAPSPSFNNGLPGDVDLDKIVAPNATHDATVLEFDFVPLGKTLKFNFVFGSEEYNDFVAGGVNDVFAFLLNGTNVALLPNTSTPVSIDTVNLTMNPQFYINNAPKDDPTPATTLLNTDLDGLTTVIPVVATVNPGVVNHIKLAIADTGDSIFDSDVFIQSGSFAAPPAPLAASTPTFMAYRPFRYAFRTLEQNEGLSGPTPLGGTAGVTTFDGNVTVLNFGPASFTGTLDVEFAALPKGVTVVNATGVDATTNLPFIKVSNVTLSAGGTVALRVPIKLSDTTHVSPGTFFEGPLFIDVLAAS